MLPQEPNLDVTQSCLVQGYEKLCCLFINWNDASNRKNSQLDEVQAILYHKYGAFINPVVLDQQDLRDTENSLFYHMENFLRKYDRRENLLVIFYSGGSYVHDGELFLDPHQNAEPTIRWSKYIDRRVLSAAASVLLIFDTTHMRDGHYFRLWDRTCQRREAFYLERELDMNNNTLQLLALNGSDTPIFSSSLKSLASSFPDGFTVSQLYHVLRDDPAAFKNPAPCLYHGGSSKPTRLVPLSWPRLQLHQHHRFTDPHNEYLKALDFVPLQEDGTCEVLRMRLGVDVQEFSSSPCLVAVKRFTIRANTRAYLRDDFLREKESLVEVSKWNHENLLGMLATFETECERFTTLNLILPFAEGGNLHEFLRLERDNGWKQRGYPFAEPALIGCLKDWRYAVYRQAIGLVDALTALHGRSQKYIIHCDIKPANVLIQRGKFKLADFGLSRFKDSDETSKTEWHRGTAIYSPPEREELMGRGRDVWALGCVLLEIALMIRYAFQVNSATNLVDIFEMDRRNFSKKTGGDGRPIFHKTMPCVYEVMEAFNRMRDGLRKKIIVDGMIPVIRSMLQEDQKLRITAPAALSILKDHYIMLQSDPLLRQDIQWSDNPGGPPNCPEAWNSLTGSRESPDNRLSPRANTQLLASTGDSLSPSQLIPTATHPASREDSQPHSIKDRSQICSASCPELQTQIPQPSRPLFADSDSGGAASRLSGLEIHSRKRPLVTDESMDSNKRSPLPNRWPEHFIF